MTYQLKIPQKHVELLAKVCTRKRFFYGKDNIPNHSVFSFKEKLHRDFMAECLADVMGRTSPHNIWTAGTIIMGNDRSYERSFYEVLADNVVFVLLLARRYGGIDINHECYLHIELKANYSVNTDHFIKPSHVYLDLPDNWVDDFKKIRGHHMDKPWNRIKVLQPKVYDFNNQPDRYEEWLNKK